MNNGLNQRNTVSEQAVTRKKEELRQKLIEIDKIKLDEMKLAEKISSLTTRKVRLEGEIREGNREAHAHEKSATLISEQITRLENQKGPEGLINHLKREYANKRYKANECRDGLCKMGREMNRFTGAINELAETQNRLESRKENLGLEIRVIQQKLSSLASRLPAPSLFNTSSRSLTSSSGSTINRNCRNFR